MRTRLRVQQQRPARVAPHGGGGPYGARRLRILRRQGAGDARRQHRLCARQRRHRVRPQRGADLYSGKPCIVLYGIDKVDTCMGSAGIAPARSVALRKGSDLERLEADKSRRHILRSA